MVKKVSMIIPCFNVPLTALDRMMRSVFNQNYSNIEIIMVNDGSTDDTLGRLKKWEMLFNERGFITKIFSKINGGIASAINVGLSHFTGDFVCFPDADDILSPEYVSRMISSLEKEPATDWARCFADVVDGNSMEECLGFFEYPDPLDQLRSNKDFIDYLLQRIEATVCVVMVRSCFFRKCIPSLTLNENFGPQEWQILLPLSFYGKCCHVPEVLYTRVKYPSSHFHRGISSFENYERHTELDRESQMKTLRDLPINNLELCYDMANLGYLMPLRMRFEKENSRVCASELHKLCKKYLENPPEIENLIKKHYFLFYINALGRYFDNYIDKSSIV